MAVNATNLSSIGPELDDFPITPGSEFPASYNATIFAARWMWCDVGGTLVYTNVNNKSRTRVVQAGMIPFGAIAVASFTGSGLYGYV